MKSTERCADTDVNTNTNKNYSYNNSKYCEPLQSENTEAV